jgi:hypothetical protein
MSSFGCRDDMNESPFDRAYRRLKASIDAAPNVGSMKKTMYLADTALQVGRFWEVVDLLDAVRDEACDFVMKGLATAPTDLYPQGREPQDVSDYVNIWEAATRAKSWAEGQLEPTHQM